MAPMTLSDIQSPVASSSTLWATATKEWVIPAKPKPGRKPKKEAQPQPQKEPEETDGKGRRVQNRAAQRAFRERKQSQLAELQARVQSYEQGEIERNVALQNISKRLKEENQTLRAENASLKEELERLKKERERDREAAAQREREAERKNKRWREEDSSVFLNPAHPAQTTSRKRYRSETSPPAPPAPIARIPQPLSIIHSPPSLASTPDSNGGSITPFSPLPFVGLPSTTTNRSQTVLSSQIPLSSSVPPTSSNTAIFSRTDKPLGGPTSINSSPFDPDCGLCSDESNCVCREFALHQAGLSSFSIQDQNQDLKVDLFDIVEQEQDRKPTIISIPPASTAPSMNGAKTHGTVGDAPPTQENIESSTLQSSSILDNLPAYQPPIPLPNRRNANKSHTSSRKTNSNGSSTMGTIFQIRLPSPEPTPVRSPPPTQTARRTNASFASTSAATSAAASSQSVAVCSGDPSNCMACKDDDFGKAFCRALGDSICSVSPCATCPKSDTSGNSTGGCCGGGKCGKATPCADGNGDQADNSGKGPTVISLAPADETDLANAKSISRRSDHVRGPSTSASSNSATTTASSSNATTALPSTSRGETIPTSDAWRQLKSHPNIAFADLSMLADVVARRTKCTGPTTVIHPPPGSLTPERFGSPGAGASAGTAYSNKRGEPGSSSSLAHGQGHSADNAPVLLTDPHARYHEQQRTRVGNISSTTPASGSEGELASGNASPPPSLVPQEELRQCGRARLREVDSAGVREALRILDAQFGRR